MAYTTVQGKCLKYSETFLDGEFRRLERQIWRCGGFVRIGESCEERYRLFLSLPVQPLWVALLADIQGTLKIDLIELIDTE